MLNAPTDAMAVEASTLATPPPPRSEAWSRRWFLAALLGPTGLVVLAVVAFPFVYNVAISFNVGPVSNSSELLQSPRSAKTLDDIEAVYGPSLVIFDMPPLLQSDDTSGFLNKTDCALIVAEAGASTVEQIDRSERMLSEQTNVLGVVLNKTRFKSDVYSSYDYYSK